MNKKLVTLRYFYLVVFVLLCAFMGFITATPSLANGGSQVATPTATEIGSVVQDPNSMTRLDMIRIAEWYATYRWQPLNSDATILELVEGKHGEEDKWVPTNRAEGEQYTDWHHKNSVDTPDMVWCNEFGSTLPDPLGSWGCWQYSTPNFYNYGIPYFWGGHTAIKTNALNGGRELYLTPIDGKGVAGYEYFDERLSHGYPAGDVVSTDGEQWSYANGVDCTGYVMQVWRLGTGYTPSMLVNMSRPILFRDLQEGDIIYQPWGYYAHAIIFDRWVNFDPMQPPIAQEPVADPQNGTEFYAYEAARAMTKVVRSKYRLIGLGAPRTESYGGDLQLVGTPTIRNVDYGYSNTQQVTIQRLESCTFITNPETHAGEKNCIDGDGARTTIWGAYPRTYFSPIDVEFVIDASPSMNGTMLSDAKSKAADIVNMLQPGDKVGVVGFDGAVTFQQSLIQIRDDEYSIPQILYAINSVQPKYQGTSIGSGLRVAKNDLEQWAFYDRDPSNNPNNPGDLDHTRPDPVRVIVLFSDGEENLLPYADPQFLTTLHAANIPVYVVQLGGKAVQNMKLQDIASYTGGRFTWSSADLPDHLHLNERVTTGTVIRSIPDHTVPPELSVAEAFQVDNSIGSMTVKLTWTEGSGLYLTLERPDGIVYDPTSWPSDNGRFTVSGGNGFLLYKVQGPQPGQWIAHISGQSGRKYDLKITASSALEVNAGSDHDEYPLNGSIQLLVGMNDDDSPAPTETAFKPVPGATVMAIATYPDLTQSEPFYLNDNGTYGDAQANDGIYTALFNDTEAVGVYRFKVEMSGTNNREGEASARAFTREEDISVAVVEAPRVISIAPDSPSPTNYYHVNYTVKFSESVVGVDISDFTLTTDGVSGTAIRTMPWGVDTGSGNGTIRLDLIDDDTIEEATPDGNVYNWENQVIAAYNPHKLGTRGIGNGNFEGTEIVVDKTTRSTVVTKLEDTDDGMCDADCSLREAIAAAFPGETVSFDTALSGGTIHLNSTLVIYNDVTVDGSMLADPITISGDTNNDGTRDVRTFEIKPGATVILNSLTISKSRGYGVNNNGMLSVTDSTFSDNGGGIYHRGYDGGTLAVMNSTFVGNSTSNGAGIYLFGGTETPGVFITNSTFLNNSASTDGGGVYNSGDELTITGSTFSGNSAARDGGAIQNEGTLTIANTTIAGSTARVGGAIHNDFGRVKIVNGTLSNNSASDKGGGIFSWNSYYSTANLYLINTIIANSPSGGDCVNEGGITPGAPLLVGDAVPGWGGEGNSCYATLTGDPLLAPLADNGGPTQTMALLPGSPAINAGRDDMCAAAPINNLDQRGVTRPQDAHCDLGAFELIDDNSPTVSSITIANTANTQSGYLDFTVTFSEPVTGVDVSDFTLTTTDAPGAAISTVSGSGTTYTISVAMGTGQNSLIRLDVLDDDTILDLASHPLNGGFTSGQTYTMSKVVSKLADTNDNLCDADCSLREAIAAAAPGDTITFDSALSGGTIRLVSTLNVLRNMTIDGSALTDPIIISGDTNDDGTGDVRILYVDWDVTASLKHLVISKGYDPDEGGGIYSGGPLTITDSTFSGNRAGYGGAISGYYPLTILNSTFSDNSATSDGGAVLSWGALTLTDSDFSGNHAVGSGGAFYSTDPVTITHSTFSANSAHYGGAITTNYNDVTITDSSFSGNSATAEGGGIYNNGSTLQMTDSSVSSNSAPEGGGIYNEGEVTAIHSTFSGNSATGDGNHGGGVYSDNWLALIGSTLLNNTAPNGGGVYNDGTLEVTNSTLTGNSASVGGGVYNDSSLYLTNSTFTGNSAATNGGGIYSYSYVVMTNSTLSGNSASGEGGGIYNDDSSFYFANSIIANSTGGDCVNVTGTWVGQNTQNLVGDGSCSAVLSGDPLLSELADNGGPTQTMALLADSPAIDAGDDAICTEDPVNNLDQRWVIRPQDIHCDIGAFEVDANAPTVVSGRITNVEASNVTFTVVFSEVVTGVDASDFTLTTTGAPGAALSSVTGSGTTYTVLVSVGSGQGTLRLDVLDDDTIRDAAFNPLGSGFTGSETYAIDDISPRALSSIATDIDLYNVSFTVTFSEYVTGVDVSDFALDRTGAPLAKIVGVSGLGTSYKVLVNTGVSQGTIRLDVLDDDSIRDGTNTSLGGAGAGNGNYNAGDPYTVVYSLSRVSLSTEGLDADEVSYIGPSSMSADGRYVTFYSAASNLVAGDTNGVGDIFVRDLLTNTTTRVSVATDGTQGNGETDISSISADGRYIVFGSDASNLVSGDTNGQTDVFLHDMQTHVTTRISVASNGAQGNAASYSAYISGNGQYVVFFSLASNLVSGDTNGVADIFVRDLQANMTTRVSIPGWGQQANGAANAPSISADGRYVVFSSQASNMVTGDTNGAEDIFVHDTYNYKTTRVSVAADGTQANSLSMVTDISADGRYVLFMSYASNLVAGDTNGQRDAFVRDMQTNTTTRISVATDGTQANQAAHDPTISANGRYVVFLSPASNLVAGDTNGQADIFLRDLQANTTTLVSVAMDGTLGDDWAYGSALSADGRYIAFASGASNLVNGDVNGMKDIFVLASTADQRLHVMGSTRASPNPTNAARVDFSVTFSEPVTGVDASDFTLTTTSISDAAIGGISGSGMTYTVTVNTGNSSGTIRLNVVDDDTILNAAGDVLGGSGAGNGNFIRGEAYIVYKNTGSKVVTKLADTNDGSCNADCSLREAIAKASLGDTITFDAALSGGTIHLTSALNLSRNITIDGSTLAVPITISGDPNNGTSWSRAFYVNSGVTAALRNLVISRSQYTGNGGGIYNEGTLIITNSTFSDNHANSGGGIYNTGSLTITNSTFSGNSAFNGGAVYNTDTLTITTSSFSGNLASAAGGIYNQGTLVITDSTFAGNTGSYRGGAIYDAGVLLEMTGTTLSGNSAFSGAGIYNSGTGLEIADSTFSGNSASYGGGVENDGTLTIMNSTLSGNSASVEGGGIRNYGGSLHYANTIIANSVTGGNCANANGGVITTNTANLVEDGSCSAALSGDPLLDALADNGGPTQTMALLPGSPARDTGDDAVCAAAPVSNLDQRGNARPQGLHCDIGAFEAPLDETAPSVSSVAIANAQPGTVSFTVTYSEPVTGVDVSDFALTTTGSPNAAIDNVSGSGTAYTVTVNASGEDGTIRLDVLDDDTIVDMASNPLNGGFIGGEVYTIDRSTPTVLSSVVTETGPYSVSFTVTFSEPVTGVDASDFALERTDAPLATIAHVIGSGASYTVLVSTGINQGTLRLDVVDDDSITDGTNPLGGVGIGNGNYQAGAVYTISYSLSRISTSTSGGQGDLDSYVFPFAMSGDGRYLTFYSEAASLVEGDTNEASDSFLRDTQTNTTVRVSVGTDSTEGNNWAIESVISANGRYVVFRSDADNLVPGDTNESADIFLRDLQTNTTTCISVATDGTKANDVSYDPYISSDGRYVTFYSHATNLVAGDANGTGDIFLRDTQTNTTTRVSVASDGTQGNGWSGYPASISATGRYIVFYSEASNLVPGDTNGKADFFLRDTQSNTTTRVSVATDGTQGNDNAWWGSDISADGRYVVFYSLASNLVAGDTNASGDVFLRDTQTNTTTRISLATDGTQADSYSKFPVISADGRYVAFLSHANNLVPGDTNDQEDIFVRDLLTNITTRISTAADGTQENGWAWGSSLSADGRSIAYSSSSDNLISGDTNGVVDVFLLTSNASLPPQVISSVRTSTNPTAAASVDFTVTFSEPVTGVDAGDFTLTTTGLTGAAISGVSGSGTTYTVTVNTGSGSGTLRLDIGDDDTIVSAEALPLGGTGTGNGSFTTGEAYDLARNPSDVTVTVLDTDNQPRQGLHVYAFTGSTYTGRNETTDENGQVTFTLPVGSYRFRADLNGTQFWSGAANHCDIPGCASAALTVTYAMTVTVQDTGGAPQAGLRVYAFSGSTYTGYNSTTNASGQAVFTLPPGSYRFRADLNGTQFWSGLENHCEVPGCTSAAVTVTYEIAVTVRDTNSALQSGLRVYAFNDSTYTGYSATTNGSGQAIFTLPQGSYRFRADLNGTQFWSGAANHCEVPGCTSAAVTVTYEMLVTVRDTGGAPQAGLHVYAFNGSTYTGYTVTTNGSGQAIFTLPQGSYRFRADLNGTQFWSGASNHCDIPGCTSAAATVTYQMTVTVLDTADAPKEGLHVYAFNGSTYTGYNGTTDANGQVILTLPQGSYRFRADLNGTQFWSGTENHCAVPGCVGAAVTVTYSISVTVRDTDSQPQEGLHVYAFNGSAYTGYNAMTNESGQAVFTLPVGNYRFRADLNGTQFWSDTANHCEIPGCSSAGVTVTNTMTVTVLDTDGAPKEGLHVYAFDGSTYTGYNKTTNVDGQAVFTLPLGSYRFRADLNGTQFWSDVENHCTLPGCDSAQVTVTIPVTVLIQDAEGAPVTGVNIYAFNGNTYTGYTKVSDANGQAVLTLPVGDYRFRVDRNGVQHWSEPANHCSLPGCLPVTVTISP